MPDMFDAMKRFMKTQREDSTTEGRIVSIAGTTALVKLSGSDRIQEAWYNKGANLAPGDHCILQRTSGNAKWVVQGGYGTMLSGINEQSVQTAPSAVSGNAESVASYQNAASGVAVANITGGNNASFTTWATANITTTKAFSHILCGFSGCYVGTSTTTSGTWIIVRILIGGAEVARCNANLAKSSWSGETTFYANVSLSGLRRSVPVGFYNCVAQVQSPYSSIESANITSAQFYSVEI